MAGLQITITDAGRADLPNGPNTGTSAVTISHVGISNVHTAGSLKGLTTLPGEIKRVTTFGGDVVADDVVHVTINDETTDVYSVRAFGLYLSTGVLFAVFSSPDVVVEKSAGAMVLLSADITFKTLDTAVIQFGGTGFINPPATTERLGVVELATWEESAAGSRADVAVTPFGLLKTLQSWATNFAGAIHRHAMTAIDGLPEALANKSPVGHKHDATDTISGVFDAGRIPALAMEKVIGLANALASKAAALHGHNMSDIDGLGQALLGKAAAAHGHVMSEIIGLADAIAGRAPALHSHDWAQVTGKPSLARTDTTDVMLASHPTGMAVQINGSPWRALAPLNTPVFEGGAGAEGGEVRLKRPTTDTALSDDLVIDVYQNRIRIFENANPLRGAWIDLTGCAPGIATQIWHSSNFNPADKAPALHSHAWEQISSKPSLATTDGTAVYIGAHATGMAVRINGSEWRHLAPLNTPVFEGGVGPEGGEIRLKRPASDTTLSDDVVIDLYQNRLRIFENANPLRGAWLDLAALPAGIGAQLLTDAVARNLGSPGYAVIPGTGLMIQWGFVTSNIAEGSTHAVLPVAFGGGCLVALATPRNPGSNVNSDYYMQVVGRYQDRIVFFANRANGSAGNLDGYEWIALGRVSGSPDPAYNSGGGGGGGGGEIDPYV